jgi:hypothetical protein
MQAGQRYKQCSGVSTRTEFAGPSRGRRRRPREGKVSTINRGNRAAEITSYAPGDPLDNRGFRGEFLDEMLDEDALLRGTRRIAERYDARTDVLEQSIPVPRGTAELDVDGQTIVYRFGRSIYVMAPSGLYRPKASGKPIGLSVEGRRIAWAENVGKRRRIRAVTLP